MNTIAIPPSNISVPPIELGLRYTWASAPFWWNPLGEQIYQIKGDDVFLHYWRNEIKISSLRVVEEAGE